MFRTRFSNDLPPKAKLPDEITAAEVKQSLESDNAFCELTYRKKPWLFGFFGKKDGTSDAKYYSLKSEISAFASEYYRLFTDGHSPKYRSVYDRRRALVFGTYSTHYHLFDDYVSERFITQKIENSLTLEQVFKFLRYLGNDGVPFSAPYVGYYYGEADKKNYFVNAIKQMDEWHERAIQRTHETLDPYQRVMEEKGFLALKATFVDFLGKTKHALLFMLAEYESQFTKEGNLSAYEINEKLRAYYNTALEDFCQKQLDPVKVELIKNYEHYLMKNGLPEIMAVGYALGEWSFKARDILVDTKEYKILKIDHERCLWEISHTLLVDMGLYEPKSKGVIANHQSISSQDIDEFPKRTNPPRFWPSREDDNYYPDWFHQLLDQEEFKKRAYTTWLAIAVTPDQRFVQWGRFFLNPVTVKKSLNMLLGVKIIC
ncbi:hypothetical protein [Legionella taurinensis]|uniref:Uncharacterized protein n=1 Tax=Legionella taurinensis TaxID=70611 RepID=A0A3A5LHP1_9GAMM|nr:hypothetical protein [Legionella taurinensis]RJT46893.1 hypothetical protein D6J04_07630 [Legionella taurinensis]RJT66906.1 hypothetical protein D6J03_09475 [Legionella taurinensis]STY25363.1 Uncharacterised protein [Legionella taurinensis]